MTSIGEALAPSSRELKFDAFKRRDDNTEFPIPAPAEADTDGGRGRQGPERFIAEPAPQMLPGRLVKKTTKEPLPEPGSLFSRVV